MTKGFLCFFAVRSIFMPPRGAVPHASQGRGHAHDLGISAIAHRACREDGQAGMVRRINMVHHQDFSHPELLEELSRLYIGRR